MISEVIVDEIIEDILSRKGLNNEWEEIGEQVQQQIKDKWQEIIRNRLMKII